MKNRVLTLRSAHGFLCLLRGRFSMHMEQGLMAAEYFTSTF